MVRREIRSVVMTPKFVWYSTSDIYIGLYSQCLLCSFRYRTVNIHIVFFTANVYFAILILDSGPSHRFVHQFILCYFDIGDSHRFLQPMSTLLIWYWTVDIHVGLYSQCIICFVDIGQWAFTFVQPMYILLFRYLTVGIHKGLYSKCLICFRDVGQSCILLDIENSEQSYVNV